MLAGMIQLPERYSPFNHLDGAYRRRSVVLQSMVAAGRLTREQARDDRETPVAVADPHDRRQEAGFAAYFVEEVRRQLEQTYGADRLYTTACASGRRSCRATSTGSRRRPASTC